MSLNWKPSFSMLALIMGTLASRSLLIRMLPFGVVIIGSPNVNAGYKLVHNAAYPQIATDYERTWRVLKSLPCDIFLGAHGDYFGLVEKYPRFKEGNPNPFIDPDGYKKYVAQKEKDFYAELKKQEEAAQAATR